MDTTTLKPQRVLSGMRASGQLHLGHYHGVLRNWVQLQHQYECFFFAADWHALTTEYENPSKVAANVWDMVIDWVAAGVNPGSAKLFIQSRVPEHAELHLLLSMMTPLGWLERVPTYKDQQEKLREKDLATYGFLGYPLLQSADILIYQATKVPVGEDQVAHIELTREVARRFNHLYGRDADFEEKAHAAIKRLGKKNAALYHDLRRRFQELGDHEALATARELLKSLTNMTIGDKERLFGYLEGTSKIILQEPQALLTAASRFPGLDGQKMSKSYGNTITLRDERASIEKKIKTMPTDPARVRRTDPGDPARCPVWQFHQIYSDDIQRDWVNNGCRSASIGCLECKQPIIDAIDAELTPVREKALELAANPSLIRSIIADGCEEARSVARETLEDVRHAMGVSYR